MVLDYQTNSNFVNRNNKRFNDIPIDLSSYFTNFKGYADDRINSSKQMRTNNYQGSFSTSSSSSGYNSNTSSSTYPSSNSNWNNYNSSSN